MSCRALVFSLLLVSVTLAAEPKPEPPPLPVDEVQLLDGSRILGTVLSQKDGVLTVHTAFAGDLKIKADAVKGINANRPLTFTPAKGQPVTGVPTIDPQRGQVVAPAGGEAVVTQPKTITDPNPPAGLAALAPPQNAGTSNPVTPPANAPAEKNPWAFRLEMGLNGSTGNTERFNFNGRAEANRTEPDDRLKLYTEAHYGQENGVKSKNEAIAGIRYEKDLSERWFLFGKGEAEYDEFEQISYRLTGSGGIGYFWVREKDLEFKTRVGVGYQHETFFGGSNTDRPILDLGYDFRWDVWEYLRFTNSLTLFPSLLDPMDKWRAVMETAGEIPLAKDGLWRVRAGMRNEYNNEPRPGVDRLDTTYFLNLVYEMK
jgi:putative salt-induced outer membrane protein YdiY